MSLSFRQRDPDIRESASASIKHHLSCTSRHEISSVFPGYKNNIPSLFLKIKIMLKKHSGVSSDVVGRGLPSLTFPRQPHLSWGRCPMQMGRRSKGRKEGKRKKIMGSFKES